VQILGAYTGSAPNTPAGMPPQNQFSTPRSQQSPSPQQNGAPPAQYQNGQYQNGTPPAQYQNGTPPAQYKHQNGASPAYQPNGFAMTMNVVEDVEEEEILTELEKAMRNLVNVDRIDEPADGGRKLTMIKKEEEKKKGSKGKSKGLPPVANNMVGNQATLSQISQVKPVSLCLLFLVGEN
jgi:hypothetical protein